MQSNIIQSKENKLLDILKYISAILVLASHCLPIVPNANINFFYGQWFFRFCVPLFIISSGYFFASFNQRGKKKYIYRIAVLYLIASLLYLPTYIRSDVKTIIQILVFGYHHLWYLSALTISLCICYVLEIIPFVKKIYPYIAIILIIIGAYYDEYKYVFTNLYNIPAIRYFGDCINNIGGSRHALFFSLPMLMIGKYIYERKDKIQLQKGSCILLTIASFVVSLAECVLLRHFGGEYITCDVTFTNFLPAVFLFILTFKWNPKILQKIPTKALRKNADILYIFHMMVLLVINRFFGFTYVSRFLLTLVVSIIVSWLYINITERIKTTVKKNIQFHTTKAR